MRFWTKLLLIYFSFYVYSFAIDQKIQVGLFCFSNLTYMTWTLHEYLESLFDEQTMSVHLQINKHPQAKKWIPGNRSLVAWSDITTKQERDWLLKELSDATTDWTEWFLEINRPSSKVIQYDRYRIVIVFQPVAKHAEMTIVRPLAKLQLDEYWLNQHIVTDLMNKWHWILIAWAPGEWKSTFAQAFIDELAKQKLIIKTIEAPRDLQVPDHITQYSFSHASHEELRDILLLSRPDVTIYDEVRNRDDFRLYADLRLAWIWLIWVMHATKAIDAAQRFLTMIDMGMMSQVIDTIISIKAWKIEDVLSLKQVVKTPAWMTADDLARPVIQVYSRLREELLYEIYTFSDNVIVMDMNELDIGPKDTWIDSYAKRELEGVVRKKLGIPVRVEVTWAKSIEIYIPEHEKPRVIGKWWSRISQLERELGLRIKVKSHEEADAPTHSGIAYDINEIRRWRKVSLELSFDPEFAWKEIQCLIWETMMTLTLNSQARIAIKKKRRVDHILDGEFEIYWIR